MRTQYCGGPPAAEHLCNGGACGASVRPFPTSAVDGEHPGGSGPGTSGSTRRPAGRVAEQSAIPSRGQRDDEVPEASAVNDAAVAAYRLSVQAGQSAVGTPARPDVRTHIPSLGASENGRCPTSAAPGLAGHRGHGLTAGPGVILASEPGAMSHLPTAAMSLDIRAAARSCDPPVAGVRRSWCGVTLCSVPSPRFREESGVRSESSASGSLAAWRSSPTTEGTGLCAAGSRTRVHLSCSRMCSTPRSIR